MPRKISTKKRTLKPSAESDAELLAKGYDAFMEEKYLDIEAIAEELERKSTALLLEANKYHKDKPNAGNR